MDHVDKFERFSGNTIVRQNLKQKSVHAALFMASAQGADLLLRFISTIILARLLLPEYFGLVAMVTAVTGIAEIVKDLGLSYATIQRNDITHTQVSNLFWINVTAGFIFFLFFSSISILISKFYNDHRLILITIAVSANYLWYGLHIQHKALLSRQLKHGQIAVIQLLSNFLSIVAAVLLAIYGYGYWSLVWREVIRNLFNTVGIWLYCPWMPGLPKRGVGTKEFLRFGRNLSITHFILGMVTRLDGVLVGKFFGAAILGIYRQAFQLLVAPVQQINQPIASVAQPVLSRLQLDPKRYRKYYKKMLFFINAMTVPLAVFSYALAKEIVLFLLGANWIGAVPFVKIFAILAVMYPTVGTYTVVLISCNKTEKFLLIALLQSAALILFMIIGLQWGAVGIAYAHVLTGIVLMVPKLYYSFIGTPVTIGLFFKTIMSPVFSGLGMMTIIFVLLKLIPITNVFLLLLISGVVGIIGYLAILILLPAGREDVMALYKEIMSSLNQGKMSGDKAKLRTA